METQIETHVYLLSLSILFYGVMGLLGYLTAGTGWFLIPVSLIVLDIGIRGIGVLLFVVNSLGKAWRNE